MDGFVVIDKPKGPTSHQIDYWVREITGEQKVGHIGTLDPNVTGVLVMALGKAVKLIDIVHEYTKEYVFVVKFHGEITEEQLARVAEEFTGEVYQIPPMRSAVARNLRVRRIHSLDTIEMDGRNALMKMVCDSGTYVRTLCTDMGYVTGTGAQMIELRRLSTGMFTEEKMITLQALSDAFKLAERGNTKAVSDILIPMDFIFRDTPKIIVKKSALRTISHGSDLFPGGIKAIIGKPLRGDRVCVFTENNEMVGAGKMLVSYADIGVLKVLDFDRILIEPVEDGEKPEGKREDILVRKERRGKRIPVQKPQRRSGSGSGRAEGGKSTRPGRPTVRRKYPGSERSRDKIRQKKDRR